jgi:hypothetical protein
MLITRTEKYVLGLIALLLAAPVAKAEGWYMGHIGADTCVPAEVVDGPNGQRSSYKGGSYHTPEDIKQVLTKAGARVEEDYSNYLPPGAIGFKLIVGDKSAIVLMFNDKAKCQDFMAKTERQGG